MAARSGEPNIASNNALRVAVENAKADNVPNANIERAIKKGSGALAGEQMAEVMYAAYGPGGVACLIECLTDNKNRTLSNVKMAINKHGGNWAESASVLWMFARKGVVVAKGDGKNIEEIELELIDFGAEDTEASDGTVSVTTDLSNWTKVRDFLKQNGYEILSAGLKYMPTQKMEVKDAETARKLMNFVSAVEEDDDVSEVHTNADISEQVAAQMG
jgi:YebC/PmpR family DNA-binding regulatory protein